ncbi:LysR family transcriptional regulator [Streptomyces sp. CAI-85]|uniref:LysR family transcriptional regulator n=1 Tax=Streptomyces sp. CAI-85 TaxID=1472662 RepID=UPI001587D552|nr:LysR family transcriptional regulator [Streptomyces sp. CAI-85]NUV59267.1 LysR family transcriptional regulator [Streptomyces sp. CAI-85]
MKLELRHLEALCSIAETGSIRKAARHLGMSQPALTNQVRRIEEALGGKLFSRDQHGCRPTPLGQAVLGRARPLVAQMGTLLSEIQATAARTPENTLRIGATANRALPGWLRRLRSRFPGRPVSLHIDASAQALSQDLARGQLDIVFVHEFEAAATRMAGGLGSWTLLEREPQFIALAVDHPAAASPVVDITSLAQDHWIIDTADDGQLAGVQRALLSAGLNPSLLQADPHAVSTVVATGGAVALHCPVADHGDELAVRPLRDDPITVRLQVYGRPGTEMTSICADLKSAYREAAFRSSLYRAWLSEHGNPLDRRHGVKS